MGVPVGSVTGRERFLEEMVIGEVFVAKMR